MTHWFLTVERQQTPDIRTRKRVASLVTSVAVGIGGAQSKGAHVR
jgi:hypothetical protein